MNRAIRQAMGMTHIRMGRTHTRMRPLFIPAHIMRVRPSVSICGLNRAVEGITGTMADGAGITANGAGTMAEGAAITADGAAVTVDGAEEATKRTAPNFRLCGEMYIL